MPRPRTTSAALLVLLTLAGFAVRWRGLDDLLPHVMHRDGMVHVRQTEHFQRAAEDPGADRMLSYNPHLYSRIAALWPVPAVPEGRRPSLDEALAVAKAPWLRLREISAVLSLLLIPGTYLFARRFLDRAGSLFAAGLTATCLLHVLASVQEKAHAMVASFLLLALLAAMRLRRKPDVASYLLAGVAAALAVGSLHNGFLCLPAIGVAWLLRERSPRRASPAWILAPAALIAASLVLFWPFLLEIDAPHLQIPESQQTPTAAFLRVFTSGSYHLDRPAILLRAVADHDPVLVAAVVLGVLAWIPAAIRRRASPRGLLRGDVAVVLAYSLPYSLSLLFLASSTARYIVPLLPILACIGGYAFSRGPARWLARIREPAARAVARTAAGAAVLALPFWMVWRYAEIRARPDTLEEAARWIEGHVQHGEGIVVVPPFDLPLLPTPDALAENVREPWRSAWAETLARGLADRIDAPRFDVRIQPGPFRESRGEIVRDPGSYFRRCGAQYVVLATPANDRARDSARAWLSANGKREARLSPLARDDGRDVHALFHNDPGDPSVWMLPGLRALGPTVEIYSTTLGGR